MADRVLELVLPWPSRDLSPNARVHRMAKARATRAAKETALLLACRAGWRGARLPAGRLHLWVTFHQAPGKALPDVDNMIGRFKAYRDGLAIALGIDDKRFQCHPEVSDRRRPGGEVVVRITANDERGNCDD